MLREEIIDRAAALHTVGARNLRDAAACLLPCLPIAKVQTGFVLSGILRDAERVLSDAITLSAGLIRPTVTKFTAACEARMALLGVPLSLTTAAEAAAVRARVAPGTRTDLFNGFEGLGERAAACADGFCTVADGLLSEADEGKIVLGLPRAALLFLRRMCADYASACRVLKSGEKARLMLRTDLYAAFFDALRAQVNAPDADAEQLAALASTGKLTAAPPLLCDLALRCSRENEAFL